MAAINGMNDLRSDQSPSKLSDYHADVIADTRYQPFLAAPTTDQIPPVVNGFQDKMGVAEKKENTEDAAKVAEFEKKRAHFYGQDDAHGSTTRSFVILGVIFVCSLLLLFFVYLSFPQLEESEKQHVKVPKNIEDAKQLGKVLSKYKDQYYMQVLVAYFTAYVFLQSFAIPGSIFLSILSGFLFPFSLALFLVCLCSATGASFCYLLSFLVGRRLVWRYVPERAIEWSAHVQRHSEHLLNYIIFLRITPFLPNWFINIVSPVINVPLSPFFIGTFLGVAPPSFVAIQAGTTLQQLTSSSDTVSWTSITVLAVLAVLSLLPIAFRNKLKQKFD